MLSVEMFFEKNKELMDKINEEIQNGLDELVTIEENKLGVNRELNLLSELRIFVDKQRQEVNKMIMKQD